MKSSYLVLSRDSVDSFILIGKAGNLDVKLVEKAAHSARIVVGIQRKNAQSLWHIPILISAKKDKALGVTIGKYVYLRRQSGLKDWKLLVHELTHVVQYYKKGNARFLFRYGTEFLRNRARGMDPTAAYLALTVEVEARRIALLAGQYPTPKTPFVKNN